MIVGDGRPLQHRCSVQFSRLPQPFQPETFGPDAERMLTCDERLTIRPSAALDTGARGTTATVSVPGPGSLTATPGASGRLAQVSAKAAPLFKPVTVTVAEAGPVDVKLKLSKRARKTFKRKQKLPLRLALAFTPADGGPVVKRSQRLVLRAPVRLAKP